MKIGRTVRTLLLASLLLCFVMPGAACVWAGVGADRRDSKVLVKSLNAFAVESYQRLIVPDGNLFFSPLSIATVFAMVYGGARGNTAQQIEAVFRFPKTGRALHEGMAVLVDSIEAAGKTGNVKLRTANGLWPQEGYPFLEEYLSLARKQYRARISPVDFRKDGERARLTINGWVEEKTEQKIVNLIKPGMIDPLTRMVLVNAIYFKGDWQAKFDSKNTKEAPFFSLSGDVVNVPLMMNTQRYGYAELPDVQILDVPYAGDEISMVVVLPRKVRGLPDVERNLTSGRLEEWLKAITSREVIAYLPRFKATSDFRLDKVLVSMGMVDAFSPDRADFSGMDGKKGNLFIGVAVHKAYVDVNEEGTEAAAATAAGIRTTAMPAPPPVFRADHPFLFLIRHKPTGTILFMGRLVDAVQKP